MNTAERLQSYYNFDEAVIDSIAGCAADQNSRSFNDLAERYGVEDGPKRTEPFNDGRILEYYMVHTRGLDYRDAAAIRFYSAPMATPADQNMAMRAFRLFGADPEVPTMVVGMPASVGRRANRPKLHDIPDIWNGNFVSLAAPALRQLQNEGIDNCDFVGHSFGADIAASAAGVAADYDITANRGIWMEPTSVIRRTTGRLARSFASSGGQLQAYVDSTDSRVFKDARTEADSGLTRYVGGLLRLSNIAIAHSLATSSFKERAGNALSSQPNLKTSIVWGGKSELTDDAAAEQIVRELQNEHGARVKRLRIPNMHHAGGDDIDLHAAMVLQSQFDQAT